MQTSALLAAATLALGVQAQNWYYHDSLDSCRKQPASGTLVGCPGWAACFTVDGDGWEAVSLNSLPGSAEARVYTSNDCTGSGVELVDENSCVTGSQHFKSFKCSHV